MERLKVKGLGIEGNFDNKVCLSKESTEELLWWKNNVSLKNGKQICFKKAAFSCRTDASFSGWGGIDLGSERIAQSRWSSQQLDNSINFLELLAIFNVLQAFYSEVDVHIEIQCDNITAVTYIYDMGGMCSQTLDSLAKDIWEWCLLRQIVVSAVYIPGKDNTADFFSRNFSDSTEWMLKLDIFNRICTHFFFPDVDLFASRLKARLDRFVSWYPEPGAMHHNAFAFSWKNHKPYIFPPFSLVGKVMNKILTDHVENAILVFPFWKAQPWFPLILENLSSFLVRLPRHKDLLTLPHNNLNHPLHRSIQLIAVTVSGNNSVKVAFMKRLLELSLNPG